METAHIQYVRHMHTLTLCAAADIILADLSECFLVLLWSVGTTAAVICDRDIKPFTV